MSKGRVNRENEAALSMERLREVLHYDPITGWLIWLQRTSARMRVGARAGSISGRNRPHQYREVQIDKIGYHEHRLIWFYMTGRWPPVEVDHRDTDATNNKWENLREATSSQNKWNSRMHKGNRTGLKGVTNHSQNKKFWMARLAVRGERINIGLFNCPAAAHFAYILAAEKHHGEFARVA